MKNFIFISPDFPANYYKFCRELKNYGFNVLAIGDCPWDRLSDDVKENVNEYYWVHSLENYDEVYRAVAFFIFKYGKIDYLESNNEYWLEHDAALRSAFGIASGFKNSDVKKIRYKSKMKKYYQKAGVKTAKYCIVKTLKNCQKLIDEVGYPVIVKPDNGIGAAATYKISNEQELVNFLETKPEIPYIMEEYVEAEVNSYDAIIDAKGNPVFETGNITPNSLMDVVNESGNCMYYIVNELAPDVADAGRRTVKAFNVKNRFIHFEFFRLTKDQRIGKKGEVVALEVNMRPAGGFTPDMMNFANSTDVYKIWADTIANGKTDITTGEKFYCAYAGRRDGKNFVLCDDAVKIEYADNITMVERIPDVLSNTMGNTMFVAKFKTKSEMDNFYKEVLKTR
ncbi:MAG: ATP-grasp domain-containing protein [Clostridia bacterium]|nr:ATP-grasp domain-containing protein [Clostridia bacterium]